MAMYVIPMSHRFAVELMYPKEEGWPSFVYTEQMIDKVPLGVKRNTEIRLEDIDNFGEEEGSREKRGHYKSEFYFSSYIVPVHDAAKKSGVTLTESEVKAFFLFNCSPTLFFMADCGHFFGEIQKNISKIRRKESDGSLEIDICITFEYDKMITASFQSHIMIKNNKKKEGEIFFSIESLEQELRIDETAFGYLINQAKKI